jgi:thiamine biosynthesis lipoprotein
MKNFIPVILSFIMLVSGCAGSGIKTVQKTEGIMGTDVTITVVSRSEAEGAASIDAAMAEVRRFDRMMSLYKDDSEITKINLAAGKHPVRVSPEMIEAVEAAARVSVLTNGVFDVTIGPLVVLWQMRLKEGKIPSDREIEQIRPLVNYRNIIVDRKASTIFLKRPHMIMDLGGMKGYIADRVKELLVKRGVDNAVIALAGDIWVLGRREDGKPWRIGVQHPREPKQTIAVLDLSDKYISTSGDYERYTIVEKKRYHHIIDPRTGKPSTGVISATLIGAPGALIDPLSKAPFILGPEEGMKILKKAGAEAIIVDEQGKIYMTDGIKNFIEQPQG